MHVTHSVLGDSAYIALKEIGPGEAAGQHLVEDDRLNAMVALDLDDYGRLIGIEVIGAEKGLPPEALEGADKIDT